MSGSAYMQNLTPRSTRKNTVAHKYNYSTRQQTEGAGGGGGGDGGGSRVGGTRPSSPSRL